MLDLIKNQNYFFQDFYLISWITLSPQKSYKFLPLLFLSFVPISSLYGIIKSKGLGIPCKPESILIESCEYIKSFSEKESTSKPL